MYQGDKMRRFNYDDNDEFREDIDRFFNEEVEKYEKLVEEEFALQEAQLDIAYREFNHKVMRTAVRICEKSFWWSFYSPTTRVKMILDTYAKLKKVDD